jgi:GNAT superfamily N-acetyltransferase
MNVARLPLRPPGGVPRSVTLADGSILVVRSLRRDDGARLRRMYDRCSPETIYRRFMTPVPRFSDAMIRALVDIDGHNRDAVVIATLEGEIVGVARFHRVAPHEAEFAVEVEDAWQRRGLGRLLSGLIGTRARANGIEALTGAMLAENIGAQHLLKAVFPQGRHHVQGGELTFRVPLEVDGAARPSAARPA